MESSLNLTQTDWDHRERGYIPHELAIERGRCQQGQAFNADDEAKLRARGTDPADAARAGIRRVDEKEGALILDRKVKRDGLCSGLSISYFADKECPAIVAQRIRLDIPMEMGQGKKPAKYLQKRGSFVRAYFPYPFVPEESLADISYGLILVEGEFKALSLQLLCNRLGLKILVVAIAGVNCWSVKTDGQLIDEYGNVVDYKQLLIVSISPFRLVLFPLHSLHFRALKRCFRCTLFQPFRLCSHTIRRQPIHSGSPNRSVMTFGAFAFLSHWRAGTLIRKALGMRMNIRTEWGIIKFIANDEGREQMQKHQLALSFLYTNLRDAFQQTLIETIVTNRSEVEEAAKHAEAQSEQRQWEVKLFKAAVLPKSGRRPVTEMTATEREMYDVILKQLRLENRETLDDLAVEICSKFLQDFPDRRSRIMFQALQWCEKRGIWWPKMPKK